MRCAAACLVAGWTVSANGLFSDGRAIAAEMCPVTDGIGRLGASFVTADVQHTAKGYVVSWQAIGTTQVVVSLAGRTLTERDKAGWHGAASGRVVIPVRHAGQRPFFRLTPDCGPALVLAERDISSRRLSNLRDAGGYRTAAGDWVRMGAIYRSNALAGLTRADRQALDRLGIRTVIDLRHVQERTVAPDVLPGGAGYVVADVFADASDPQVDVGSLIASGREYDAIVQLNRAMVSSAAARQAYARLFHTLAADGDGAVLFHCTAGKDRTGWGAAVLLTLLGVPRETVYADYLLSNRYREHEIEAGAHGQGTAFVPLERVDAAYLDAAFDEVTRVFGTFDNYLKQGLGLDDRVISDLKTKFLQPGQ